MAKLKQVPVVGLRKAVRQVLNQDIAFHRNNPGGSACGESFERGMIVGLQQAKRLVDRVIKERV